MTPATRQTILDGDSVINCLLKKGEEGSLRSCSQGLEKSNSPAREKKPKQNAEVGGLGTVRLMEFMPSGPLTNEES